MKPQKQPLRVFKMESKSGKSPKKKAEKPRKTREESVVISFRLPISEYEPYREPVEKSGLGKSEFFRQLFRENNSRIVISEKKHSTQDYKQYLHLVGKISNNINQLARLLNGAEKSNKITRQHYLNGLNMLQSISQLLKSKLGTSGKDKS